MSDIEENLYQEMDWKTLCDTKKEFNIWNMQWNIASLLLQWK